MPCLLVDINDPMINGRVVLDAEGNTRHMFIDVVALLGDTPGLNALLDVVGHTGAACCHCCTCNSRTDNKLLNGYLASTAGWARGSYRQTVTRHRAVHYMNFMKELRGEYVVKLESDGGELVMFLAARSKVPKTSEGLRVIPALFETHLAAIVAPDHLLCGHFRNLLQVSLHSFASPTHRQHFEHVLLQHARSIGIIVQNRSFECIEMRVLSISMLEYYSLVPCAYVAYGVSHASLGTALDGHWYHACISRIVYGRRAT